MDKTYSSGAGNRGSGEENIEHVAVGGVSP